MPRSDEAPAAMKLIGYYASPYVRRVAITLKHYGIAFAHLPYGTAKQHREIKAFHPAGRVPALVCDDGTVLVDSTMIIDHLDELAGPDRALTPPLGPERRRVQAIVGLALSATEKYVAAYYERNKRPASHVWPPWLDHLEQQVADTLSALDRAITGTRFFGEALTQAEVSTIAAVESMRFDMPHLAPVGRYPRIDALVGSVADSPAFAETRPTA